jgi:hypothetical protein
VLAIVVIWGLIVGTETLSAYRHDKNGLNALEQVKADLSPGNLTSAQSKRLLDQAHADFVSAQGDLSSPFFAPIGIVPVIGRQYTSVKDLSSSAATVSAVGSSFVSEVQEILNSPHNAGPERLESLRRLGSLSLAADKQLAGLDTGPTQALFPALAKKHNQFVTQLYQVRLRLAKAAAVSTSVASILQGPETYLVLAANNAEMRAGSGAFLDVGVASAADGNVQLGTFEPSGDHTLPMGQVNPTGDFERNWGWLLPGVDFRNLGLTPEFNVTAPLAARMWTAMTGQPVNGVMSIDIAGLKQLLEVTGPVSADGQTISADNVEQYLLHDQYVGLTDSSSAEGRQDALGALTKAVLHQLQGESTDLRTLAQAVSSAVAGRNLMMWSSKPADETAWELSGVSGSLSTNSVDVSLINRGGNKIDQFTPVDVAVTTAPAGNNTAVTLTAKLENMTPPGQSQFIAGPFPGVPVSYGGYFGLVAANLPAAASHISMTGSGPLEVGGPEGPTWVVASNVNIPDGTTTTVVVHFDMPGRHGSMTVVPSARIPAEQWTAQGRSFSDTKPTSIDW